MKKIISIVIATAFAASAFAIKTYEQLATEFGSSKGFNAKILYVKENRADVVKMAQEFFDSKMCEGDVFGTYSSTEYNKLKLSLDMTNKLLYQDSSAFFTDFPTITDTQLLCISIKQFYVVNTQKNANWYAGFKAGGFKIDGREIRHDYKVVLALEAKDNDYVESVGIDWITTPITNGEKIKKYALEQYLNKFAIPKIAKLAKENLQGAIDYSDALENAMIMVNYTWGGDYNAFKRAQWSLKDRAGN